jgi:hypothetical protein
VKVANRALGEAELKRARALAGGTLERPEDLRQVLDNLGYQEDWRSNYAIKSVRASLFSERITCIDAAILAYGLLELAFPETKRALLAIHRRHATTGEECGHCVALYWRDGQVGSFSKSNYPGLGHRDPVHRDSAAVAVSYAGAYVKMGITPLYFGTTTLEELAPDLDWRGSDQALNVLSDRLQAQYQFSFDLAS